MMVGGMFMLGFGLIAMLLVIAIPIALISGLVGVFTQRASSPMVAPAPVHSFASSPRTCSHCSQSLQADWSHCPQCGAPVYGSDAG
jgi:uncharacterized paraquat-inducible protein A